MEISFSQTEKSEQGLYSRSTVEMEGTRLPFLIDHRHGNTSQCQHLVERDVGSKAGMGSSTKDPLMLPAALWGF